MPEEGGGETKDASPRTNRPDDHRLDDASLDEGERISVYRPSAKFGVLRFQL